MIAPLVVLRPGECKRWDPGSRSHIAVLVLDGLLTRNTSLVGRTTMGLVGARDLVGPGTTTATTRRSH